MNKKIFTIILLVVFIAMIVLISIFLKIETNGSEENINQESSNEIQKSEIKNTNTTELTIVSVTSQNFDTEVLNSKKTVLVDFYATWCEPCKTMSTIITDVIKDNTNVKVAKINVDTQVSLAEEYGVISIPTLLVMKNGKEVRRSVGVISKAELQKMLK